ncbi:hypothetical protein [Afipia sp. GAS231]|uniref:hypothetical protein n=1 Tax=Afipia sp. GAS231 TaxID=1882747 RepID=UPI000B813F61|nr:hypothetical protein [Afipia sp. GAS231]
MFDRSSTMKQSEAKRLILEAWDRWVQRQALDADGVTGRDSLKFFIELQDSKSSLLNFQTRGRDKWLTIHAWLVSETRLRS